MKVLLIDGPRRGEVLAVPDGQRCIVCPVVQNIGPATWISEPESLIDTSLAFEAVNYYISECRVFGKTLWLGHTSITTRDEDALWTVLSCPALEAIDG